MPSPGRATRHPLKCLLWIMAGAECKTPVPDAMTLGTGRI